MLFFNEDWIHFVWTRYERGVAVDEQTLRAFIDQYQDTQVTDFCLNVNGTVSTAPSQVLETFAQKYLVTRENGLPVDYRHSYAALAYELLCQKQLDPYQIWVDELRRIGIRPWISIRMNDCHGNVFDTDLRKSAYVEEHPEQWRVRHRETTGYFDKCYDYGLPAVRERMLCYIGEMLDRYQPDGIELDFTREMQLVGVGAEYDSFEVITGLVAQVKELARRQEPLCGHAVRVGVLVGANVSAAFQQGFDVKDWCDRGLVDFVTILPRWETINPNMDIGLWKKLVTAPAQLGTGLQLLLNTGVGQAKMALIDHDFGQAVANLSLGADYVYLYNHFDWIESGLNGVMVDNSIRDEANLRTILQNIGQLDTAMNFKRRHVLTYDDYNAPWEARAKRLPMALKAAYQPIRLAVGRTKADARITLALGFDRPMDAEALRVYVNARKAEFVRGSAENVCTFAVPSGCIRTYAIAELAYPGEAMLTFAEIVVD